MPKYQKHEAGNGGWCEWIRPVRKGYRMACCDCGLVHEMEFKLIPWGRGKKILMRARRHERATGQIRRHMKGQADE